MSLVFPPLHLEPPPGTIVGGLDAALSPEAGDWCTTHLRGPVEVRWTILRDTAEDRDTTEWNLDLTLSVPLLAFEDVSDMIAFKMRWS